MTGVPHTSTHFTMSHRSRLLGLVAVTALGCSPADDSLSGGTGASSDPRFAALLAFAQGEMSKYNIPGVAIAVVEHGKLSFQAGIGVRKAGVPDPVTPSTLFRVGSLSKMVLAATAMKLTEEAKLDLRSPITTLVPYKMRAGFDPGAILLSDLLTHTSGIPDLKISFLSCPVGPGQAALWFGENTEDPFWTNPSDHVWNYCNRGYSLMGWAIEAASGQSYEEAVAQRVFGPASMTTATFDPALARTRDHAVGHVYDESSQQFTFSEPDAYDCSVSRPPAGIIASVVDYAHFVEALLASGGSMLTPTSVSQMETPHADTDDHPNGGESYGYGLFIRDGYKGLRVVRHSGEISTGYLTSVWMVPDRQFAAIVFTNSLGRSPEGIEHAALDAFLGLADVQNPSGTTSASRWAPYAGTYVDPFNLGTIQVVLQGNDLEVSIPQHNVVSAMMTQQAGDDFSFPFGRGTEDVVFFPNANGKITWFVTRAGVGVRQ